MTSLGDITRTSSERPNHRKRNKYQYAGEGRVFRAELDRVRITTKVKIKQFTLTL